MKTVMESFHLFLKLFPQPLIVIIGSILACRICQRIYYFLRGHTHLPLDYSPRAAMQQFFDSKDIPFKEFNLETVDKISVKYRLIGKGPKLILLTNGVGTDLFMWLPLFHFLIHFYPKVFNEITIYAPCYRGLFGSGPVSYTNKNYDNVLDYSKAITISIETCGEDIIEVMKHAKITKFHTCIGWSLGVQTALNCFSKYPDKVEKLILLNPTTGHTLHTVFQPLIPLPTFLGNRISQILKSVLRYTQTIISTSFWVTLQVLFDSFFFRFLLETSSFLGGFPPEQAPFFQEYMRDVFSSRKQTYGLLELIYSLDSPCSTSSLSLPHKTLICSGFPDFMTGVYHAYSLTKTMKHTKHVVFSMASHFLLIEWPDMVALEILKFIFDNDNDDDHLFNNNKNNNSNNNNKKKL